MVGLVVVALLGGCSSGTTGLDDAGSLSPDGAGVAEIVDIPWLEAGAPDIAPPRLGPCPPGWRTVETPHAVVCEPYGETGVADCPTSDQAHFPGEPGCRRVGPACPADGLPSDLPADRPITYVLGGAPTGGDGSRARPHSDPTSIALGSLPNGTILALGVGLYDGGLRLPSGLGLYGACVAETVLTASTAHDTEGVLTAVGADVEIARLRIADAARRGLVVNGTGRHAILDSVVVERVAMMGLLGINGGSITANELVVRDTQPRARDGLWGRGFDVEGGGDGVITKGVLDGNRELGLYATRGSSLRVADIAVLRTQPQQSDLLFGRALALQEGAQVDAARAIFEGGHDVGINVLDTGTVLRIEDSIVRGTQSRRLDTGFGRGLSVQTEASALLARVVIDANREHGLFAHDSATVELTDVVVRDTRSREDDATFGRGLSAQLGATLAVTRGVVADNVQVGIFLETSAASTLRDVVVAGTRSSDADGRGGTGLNVQFGASVEVERALFERNRSAGVLVTEPDPMDASRDAEGTLLDVVIRDTEGRQVDGLFGRGLMAQLGARVTGTRLLVERNRAVGVFSGGADVSVEHVVVRDTLARDCATTTCAAEPFGMAAGSYVDATLGLRSFALRGAPLCGVQLALGGDVDLSEGVVEGFAIGACVQRPDYDLDRLTLGVAYRDNDANLQATDLPVPELADSGLPPP
jgi:hypothetical protein